MGNPEMFTDADVPMPRDYTGGSSDWTMNRTSDAQKRRAYWDTVPEFMEDSMSDTEND